MKIFRIASVETDIRDLKSDLKGLRDIIRDNKKESKESIKDLDNRIKKVEKTLEDLSVGNRLFYQQKSIFTSVQRKIEKMEVVMDEWKKFKATMDEDDKKKVEQKTKNF